MSNCPAPAPMCPEISVLLVDDDETFRSGLAGNLRDDGHQVLEFTGPLKVPPIITLSGIQFVITDYQMPVGSGLSFADAFHQVYPEVPIVMITGEEVREVDAGNRSFLYLWRKPLDYEELHSFLHRLLDLRGTRRRLARRSNFLAKAKRPTQ